VRKAEGKRPLGRPGCGWEDNIKMDLHKVGWGWGEGTWTGLTFGFHKIQGISWLTENQLTSQEGLCSME